MMSTPRAFAMAGVFAFLLGCGDGSPNNGNGGAGGKGGGNGTGSGTGTSVSGRSPSNGAQCPSSGSGQTCTGEDAYESCLLAACSAQNKACFGNNFASGNFTGGACADWMKCELACPCDATAATCEGECARAAGQTCMTCLTDLELCVLGASCTEPVCTGGTGSGTATNTSTTGNTATYTNVLTSTSTNGTATYTNLLTSTYTNLLTSTSSSANTATYTNLLTTTYTNLLTSTSSSGNTATYTNLLTSNSTNPTTSTSTTGSTATYTNLATSTYPTSSTNPATTTYTNVLTSSYTGTSTGTSCAALQACCAKAPGIYKTVCAATLNGAGDVDATCGLGLQTFQSYCQ